MSKVNKELSIVVVSKDEAYWTSVKELTELDIKKLRKELTLYEEHIEDVNKAIKLQQAIIDLALEKIIAEKDK